MFYVYIAKDNESKLYTGITENLKKRIDAHNTKRGALFTKSGNFEIVFYESYNSLAEARQREIQIKSAKL
jgi:putative endonuclease